MNQEHENIETEISDVAVMNVTPVVSVLMSTYNQQDYLADAIDGVISQIVDFPIELIIGEDCSNDNTRAVAKAYQAKYPHIIRLIYSNTNVGAFANSNRCFAKARGEYIAYCEGDDFWHDPQKLSKQVAFLRSNPDYGLVHAEFDYLVFTFGAWRRVKNWNHRVYGNIPQGDIYPEILMRFFVRTCTVMARKDLLAQHYMSSYRSKENPVADMPLVWHMSKLAKVGYLNESLATYRRAEGSITCSGYASRLIRVCKNVGMVTQVSKKLGIGETELADTVKIFRREVLWAAFNAADMNEYISALDWIKTNDKEFSKRIHVRIRSMVIKHAFLHSLVFKVWRFVREVRFYWLALNGRNRVA